MHSCHFLVMDVLKYSRLGGDLKNEFMSLNIYNFFFFKCMYYNKSNVHIILTTYYLLIKEEYFLVKHV